MRDVAGRNPHRYLQERRDLDPLDRPPAAAVAGGRKWFITSSGSWSLGQHRADHDVGVAENAVTLAGLI